MNETMRPDDRPTPDETDDIAFVDRVAGFEAATGLPHDLTIVGIIVAFVILLRRIRRWLAGADDAAPMGS